MIPSKEIKEACERIWTEKGVTAVMKKAKWAWYRGRLVPFVAKRYLSDHDTVLSKDERSV